MKDGATLKPLGEARPDFGGHKRFVVRAPKNQVHHVTYVGGFRPSPCDDTAHGVLGCFLLGDTGMRLALPGVVCRPRHGGTTIQDVCGLEACSSIITSLLFVFGGWTESRKPLVTYSLLGPGPFYPPLATVLVILVANVFERLLAQD